MADVSPDIVTELAPTGTLRVAINFGNSVLAQKDPATGELRGVAVDVMRELASRLGVPMVGSFHTDLAAYAHLLSGSAWLGNVMRTYMRWPYGRCQRIFAPSEATRELLVRAKIDPSKIDIWPSLASRLVTSSLSIRITTPV